MIHNRLVFAMVIILIFSCSCVVPKQHVVYENQPKPQSSIHVFEIDEFWSFVVETRTETCYLQYSSSGYRQASSSMSPLDCKLLRKAVPEAAKVLDSTEKESEVKVDHYCRIQPTALKPQ